MAKFDILIVEDDPSTYKALPVILNKYGYSVQLVNNVPDALESLKNEPKFVLVDLMLANGGDGLDVLQYLYHNKPNVKCIVTTAYLDEDINLLGFPTLMKPIDLDKLLEFLK